MEAKNGVNKQILTIVVAGIVLNFLVLVFSNYKANIRQDEVNKNTKDKITEIKTDISDVKKQGEDFVKTQLIINQADAVSIKALEIEVKNLNEKFDTFARHKGNKNESGVINKAKDRAELIRWNVTEYQKELVKNN